MTTNANTNPPAEKSMAVVDGSHGEGGGQILRNSMSYACIFQKHLTITNIRANRSKPGLKAQHLAGIQLCAQIGGGLLQGGQLHSCEITYQPSSDGTGSSSTVFTGAIDTAGSICLLLQAALPCVLFRSSSNNNDSITTRLILKGGTNADMAPQYDYWELIFLPMFCQCFQLPQDLISPSVLTRGYFPRGGGHVEIECKSLIAPLPAFQLTERGNVKHIYIRSFHAGKLPKHLAAKMAKAAHDYLKSNLDLTQVHVDVEVVTEPNAAGSGLGILLVATTTTHCRLGGSTLCKPKQKADEAGRIAAKELVTALKEGGCVDEWLQDQLILYMALAQGRSTLLTGCLTLHTRTAIDIANQLVPGVQFDVKRLNTDENPEAAESQEYGKDGLIRGKHLITCTGIGYKII